MQGKTRKRRVPQLKYTETRGIGWHVSYRDPATGTPRKHRFDAASKGEAEKQYHDWVASFLQGVVPEKKTRPRPNPAAQKARLVQSDVRTGSLLHVASSLLHFEEARVRSESEPRRPGTITKNLYERRQLYSKEFLAYLNSRYGNGAVGRMELADLQMLDVEAYNRSLVESGYSHSQVSKRMRFLKTIIDRAGRPEHGSQMLTWNWDSRDRLHGKPAVKRTLPSLKQLKLVLKACGVRETAMVWMAIGCGFGQRDLAAVRVGQIDRKSYDLRRGKTGVDRYGETPPLVWKSIAAYLKSAKRSSGELMFLTRKLQPLVHDNTDSVAQWWGGLRDDLGAAGDGLGGFYVLRHLGATEFGSRPGCSIGAMRRWLGHSASSQMADVYMKPVSPEDKPVVEWVRKNLAS
ncbi:MAG: site-specific integrase [Pirellulales bacterium]|nr:site-specific integrase [Pirellulales bacterium]